MMILHDCKQTQRPSAKLLNKSTPNYWKISRQITEFVKTHYSYRRTDDGIYVVPIGCLKLWVPSAEGHLSVSHFQIKRRYLQSECRRDVEYGSFEWEENYLKYYAPPYWRHFFRHAPRRGMSARNMLRWRRIMSGKERWKPYSAKVRSLDWASGGCLYIFLKATTIQRQTIPYYICCTEQGEPRVHGSKKDISCKTSTCLSAKARWSRWLS